MTSPQWPRYLCPSCRSPIVWAYTDRQGVKVCVDADPTMGGTYRLSFDGHGGRYAEEVVMLSEPGLHAAHRCEYTEASK